MLLIRFHEGRPGREVVQAKRERRNEQEHYKGNWLHKHNILIVRVPLSLPSCQEIAELPPGTALSDMTPISSD